MAAHGENLCRCFTEQVIGVADIHAAARQAVLRIQQSKSRQDLQGSADSTVGMAGIFGDHGKTGVGAAFSFCRAPPQLLKAHHAVNKQEHRYLCAMRTTSYTRPSTSDGLCAITSLCMDVVASGGRLDNIC